MHEELIIRNFGPLKDISLKEVRPVMVFVGASGCGKSLLLKVLAMMRHITKKAIIREALKSSGVKRSPFRIRTDTYLQFSGFESLVRSDTFINYILEWKQGESCKVVLTKDGIKVTLPHGQSIGPFLKIAFIGDLRNLVASWGQRSSLMQQARTLDNHFAETLALWEEARDSMRGEATSLNFLNATLSREKRNGDWPRVYLQTDDGRRTPLERGASGYKSSIPLAMIVKYLVQSYDFTAAIRRSYLETLLSDLFVQGKEDIPNHRPMQRFGGNFLCIQVEEPELSLDPATQVLLAEELMKTISIPRTDIAPPDISLLFTTHSPYWIVALNTILEEGTCAALTWERIGGYYITPQGILDDLRDEDTHLLGTPNMDAVTEELDVRYDRALSKGEKA